MSKLRLMHRQRRFRMLPPLGKAAADHKRKAGRQNVEKRIRSLGAGPDDGGAPTRRPRGGAGANAAHDATNFVDLSDLM